MLTGLPTFGLTGPQHLKKMHVFNDEFFLFQFSKWMIARLFMQNCTYHMKMLNKLLVSEEASLNPYLLHVID